MHPALHVIPASRTSGTFKSYASKKDPAKPEMSAVFPKFPPEKTLYRDQNSRKFFKKRWIYSFLVCIIIFYPVSGSSSEDKAGLWRTLRTDNSFVLMRHASAPGIGDPDYFDVADTVIMLDAYQPRDVTEQARKLARPIAQNTTQAPAFGSSTTRRPGADVLNPSRANRDVKINTRGVNELLYGEHQIDLSQVEQLIDIGQARSIGLMIHYFAQHYANDCENLAVGLKQVLEDGQQYGLDHFSQYKVGNLALPRLHELAAAINRIRDGSWR